MEQAIRLRTGRTEPLPEIYRDFLLVFGESLGDGFVLKSEDWTITAVRELYENEPNIVTRKCVAVGVPRSPMDKGSNVCLRVDPSTYDQRVVYSTLEDDDYGTLSASSALKYVLRRSNSPGRSK